MGTIPGHNFPAVVFLLELSLQCSLAKNAFQHLKEGTRGWQNGASEALFKDRATPLELVSRSIVFLSAAAMISKVLFGARNTQEIKDRTSALRKLLSVNKATFPLLSSREVRNSLEHLDERLDNCLKGFTKGAYSFGIHVLETAPKKGMFVPRQIHPRTLIFTAAGQSVDLPACKAEIDALEAKIKTAFSALANAPYPLWST